MSRQQWARDVMGWSLQVEDWKQIKTALDGSEWKRTWLDSLFRDSVPDEPGVYILLADENALSDTYCFPRGVSGILYVGRSSNLRNRFRQHAGTQRPNLQIQRFARIFGKLRFVYTRVPMTTFLSIDEWIASPSTY